MRAVSEILWTASKARREEGEQTWKKYKNMIIGWVVSLPLSANGRGDV